MCSKSKMAARGSVRATIMMTAKMGLSVNPNASLPHLSALQCAILRIASAHWRIVISACLRGSDVMRPRCADKLFGRCLRSKPPGAASAQRLQPGRRERSKGAYRPAHSGARAEDAHGGACRQRVCRARVDGLVRGARSGLRPGPAEEQDISMRSSTARAATWRIGSRSVSSNSSPIAPRPPRCGPTSCACGSPRWSIRSKLRSGCGMTPAEIRAKTRKSELQMDDLREWPKQHGRGEARYATARL